MVIIGRSPEDNGGWGGVFTIQIYRLARCRTHFGVRAACHRFQQRACPGRFQLSSTRRPDPPENGSKLPLGKRGQPPALQILRWMDFSFMNSVIGATMGRMEGETRSKYSGKF